MYLTYMYNVYTCIYNVQFDYQWTSGHFGTVMHKDIITVEPLYTGTKESVLNRKVSSFQGEKMYDLC